MSAEKEVIIWLKSLKLKNGAKSPSLALAEIAGAISAVGLEPIFDRSVFAEYVSGKWH